MEIEVKMILDPGAYEPEKAYYDDAGFDLRTPHNVVVPPRGSAVVDTGVHLQIPHGYVGMLKSKSGLNVKSGIRGEGVVDAGYTGSIVAKMYNDSDEQKVFYEGEKLIQIVILPIPDVRIKRVVALDNTARMLNGFGSTGK